jgi:hypothetical protein
MTIKILIVALAAAAILTLAAFDADGLGVFFR